MIQKERNSEGKLWISEVSGWGDQGMSQKLSLHETSVWGAKSKEFPRKAKDFRGQWGGVPGDVAELEFRLDLSMACKK